MTVSVIRFMLQSTLAVFCLASLSCGADEASLSQAARIGRNIALACPFARPDDLAAQTACAERLTSDAELRDVMAEPFRWGQQSRLWEYDPAQFHTTRFNPRVFRRMYLSLFMFTGAVTVEQVGDLTVAHLPYVFRNGLDPGVYPYPFWHNPNKWRDYQLATELHLVFRGNRMIGALRSAVRLLSRPRTSLAWDGQWNWSEGAEPHVTLYRNLFSATNPHVARLDASYRALEEAMRSQNCVSCHRPDNTSDINPLVLFSYPNQALEGRHAIREQIERNLMPIGADGRRGIADPAERARLLELARAFESAAEDALSAESEPTNRR
jgi:hypothetical protein